MKWCVKLNPIEAELFISVVYVIRGYQYTRMFGSVSYTGEAVLQWRRARDSQRHRNPFSGLLGQAAKQKGPSFEVFEQRHRIKKS